jgi:hypothetical protein
MDATLQDKAFVYIYSVYSNKNKEFSKPIEECVCYYIGDETSEIKFLQLAALIETRNKVRRPVCYMQWVKRKVVVFIKGGSSIRHTVKI